MKPSDLSALRVPGVPTLSPDGAYAVTALRRIDLDEDDYTSQLWLVPTDGSAPPRQLTHGWRDDAPGYSPDGRWISFTRSVKEDGGKVGKPQVWLLPVDGGDARQLTDQPMGAGGAEWSADSARIAFTARVPEPGRYGFGKDGKKDEKVTPDKEPPRLITTLAYRIDDFGFRNGRPQQVFVVDVADPDAKPVQVTDDDIDHTDLSWSPDGSLLAFVSERHDNRGNDLRSDVFVCAPDGSGLRALTSGGLGVSQPRFAPDGSTVCFTGVELTDNDQKAVCRNESLWSVPLDGSSGPRRLTDQEKYNLASPGGMYLPTDDGVLFLNEHRGAVQVLRVPYDGSEPAVLLDGERQAVGIATAGGVTVVTVNDPTTWGELAVVEPDGTARPLTRWTTEGGFAQVEVNGTASDGYPVHGWLVKPDGDGPHPVLLMIHGGPFAQYGWRLFDEAQVYAGAGYAVVMGNPRGSSGYGEAHGRAVVGNVGEITAMDLLALLDAALAGDASLDGSRVGVLGGSHGGFMTTWMAAHHGERFKAAISERAVNAIDSFTGSSDIGWFFANDLYGSDLDQQAKQSPLTHADQITIPFMVVHSEHDWRCPIEQGQRLYVALHRRGVPTAMLLFPGEGHELSRSGLPSHRVARFEAILDWWRRYL